MLRLVDGRSRAAGTAERNTPWAQIPRNDGATGDAETLEASGGQARSAVRARYPSVHPEIQIFEFGGGGGVTNQMDPK